MEGSNGGFVVLERAKAAAVKALNPGDVFIG